MDHRPEGELIEPPSQGIRQSFLHAVNDPGGPERMRSVWIPWHLNPNRRGGRPGTMTPIRLVSGDVRE
jgi:hypothetical protein